MISQAFSAFLISMWEGLDHWLFRFINEGLGNPVFDAIMPVFTDLQKITWVAFGVAPVLLLLFLWKAKRKAAKVILVSMLAIGSVDSISGQWIKGYFQRRRPPNTEIPVVIRTPNYAGFSFPSNHAANNFAAATVVAAVFPQMRIWAFGVAALVAFSRVYVGVHFPADVLAGALLGILFGLLALKIWDYFAAEMERRQKRQDAKL